MLHRQGIAPLALSPGTVDAAMDGVPTSFTAVSFPQRAGNGIGEAGGKAIAAALEANTSLTSMDLGCKVSPCIVLHLDATWKTFE